MYSNVLLWLVSVHHRVQSAQQFQALQAQYSNFNPNYQFPHPESRPAEPAAAHMDGTTDQMEPTNLVKRTAEILKYSSSSHLRIVLEIKP